VRELSAQRAGAARDSAAIGVAPRLHRRSAPQRSLAMNKILAAIAGLALSLIAMTTFAGEKRPSPVVVDYNWSYAAGATADARSSTDTKQYIGCSVSSSLTNTGMNCYAQDAQGHQATCYSYNPELVKAAQAAGTDSWLFFYWDANGFCTYLSTANSSQYAPKVK
jgi:hypothetical protein